MDERAALGLVGEFVDAAGDDAAVVDGTVVTTDMLHEATDFPAGTTRYTAGWRAVGASLSDVAATGAGATAAVAVYAAPRFEEAELEAFLRGATDVCEAVGARYVGGDLDAHREFTVATTALGETDRPVGRGGATPGDVVCVTGGLGRSAAAVRLFERGVAGGQDGDGVAGGQDGDDDADDAVERANALFRFAPRVAAGRALTPSATAMMDSSDGLARSLHQLADAGDCGFAVRYADVPVHDAVREVAADAAEVREMAVHYGEDFELVATLDPGDVDAAREACPVELSVVGEVTGAGVEMDGEALPDRGYTHGE